MTVRYIQLAAAALIVLAAGSGAAHAGSAEPSDTEDDEKSGIDRYELLWRNNIFDPDRTMHRATEATQQSEAAPLLESRDQLVLTGVLVVGGTRTAFFSGTSSAFNTHGVEGEQIGPFTINDVELDRIELLLESDQFSLSPGEAVSAVNGENWTPTEGGAPRITAPDTGSKAEQTAASGEEMSLLEQLKARRQKELEE